MSIELKIGIAVAATAAVIILIALFLYFQSRRKSPSPEEDHKRIYGLRTIYFVILIVALGATLGATLQHLPYFNPDPHSPAPLIVKVTGSQWMWAFKIIKGPHPGAETDNKLTLPFDGPVEFRVTSTDVNHGFGLYDNAGTLLGQVQAMPGYVNTLYFRFPKPGTYHVLCLEYCGIGHQFMHATIKVTGALAGASPAAQSTHAVQTASRHLEGGQE